jgi:DnaK suppressor protein
MTGDGRSEAMPGKKPAAKSSKLKKAPSAKAAPRRAAPSRSEARKTVVASRKAAPATVTVLKPESKISKKPDRDPERVTPQRHAPVVSTHSGDRPASAAASSVTARTRLLPAAEEADAEGEASEASSLLAGPRNVKPYVARRGEQYMSKQQLSHFQLILLSWKRDLMQEVDRTVSHMKDEAANFPDPNDRATQEEEFSLELRTRDRERKLIRKIDEALKRIDDGSYGYCLETGEEIGIKRLEARPVATLSIEAQERRERRERQYGDRDDRYR